MRAARNALLAASAVALLGAGTSAVVPGSVGRTVDVANVHAPNAPGNPMLVGADTPASPHDRRQWLRSRRTSSRYRSLRQSTGTHKQNRRRALAGR